VLLTQYSCQMCCFSFLLQATHISIIRDKLYLGHTSSQWGGWGHTAFSKGTHSRDSVFYFLKYLLRGRRSLFPVKGIVPRDYGFTKCTHKKYIFLKGGGGERAGGERDESEGLRENG
jgi:hypothetical protein